MVYLINILLIVLAFLWKRGRILRDNPVVHEQWMRAVCMGQEETDRVIARYRKQRNQLFYLILGGCILSMGMSIWQGAARENILSLTRPEYGSGSQIYQIQVEGLNSEASPLQLEVTEQHPSAKDCRKWLEQKFEELLEQVPGENPSLDEVRTSLNLPSMFDNVNLNWSSLTPEVMNDWGELIIENIPPDGIKVWMQVKLTYQDAVLIRSFGMNVYPPEQTEEEARLADLKSRFDAQNEEQAEQTEVELPQEYEGKSLTYYQKKEDLALQICLMSVLIAAAMLSYFRHQPEKKLRERSRQLELDYAEVITRLTIYIRAGMNIRGAWERMAQEYLVRKQNGAAVRFVYEEMLLSCYRMESGIPEGAAYGEFGRQCGLHSYLRLGGLLEQNVRKGGTELLRLLEQEAQEAFEEQKNTARKIGEEAGTKMLLPMGMMLGVVLLILVVPVFAGFTI